MLPYDELQAVYAVLSGVLTVLLWALSGRLLGRERLLRRACLALALLVAAGLGVREALRPFGQSVSSFFVAVAIVFYAAGFWIPLLLLRSLRKPGSIPSGGRRIAFLLAVSVPLVALYALLVEPNRLQIREEIVPIASWPAGTPELVVAHLSDLQTVGPCDREHRALEEVRRARPDLIVVTGDYVGGPFFDTRPAEEDARAFLAELARIAPTIVVAGHCEDEEVRARVFAGLGLLYLEDASKDLDFGGGRRLRAIGLDPYKPDLRLPREPRPEGVACLVATHSPDATTELVGAGVDLHVAGHTHGGQIVVPFFGAPITLTRLPRRYARGLFRFEDHWLDVCAGLGMEGNHAPRVRLFCPPEISILRLHGSGSSVR